VAPHIGEPAPAFTLSNQYGEQVSLSDFLGRIVLITFYPFAFTGTCTRELCELRDNPSDFATDEVVTLAISCDTPHALKVFAQQEGFTHSLLSDYWPHGAVAQEYGVFLPEKGFATRGSFLVDADGILRWSVVNPPGQARSIDEYRAALAELGR